MHLAFSDWDNVTTIMSQKAGADLQGYITMANQSFVSRSEITDS